MRIGELAGYLGVNPKTIRYYEEIGVLPRPPRTASGYRDYDEGDLERLVFVRTAQRLGLRLDEIREILVFRERGEPPCAYVLEVLRRQVADLDRRISELHELRAELVGLTNIASRLPKPGAGFCTVIEHARSPRAGGDQRVRMGGRVPGRARAPHRGARRSAGDNQRGQRGPD